MTPSQPTDTAATRTDPFRWDHQRIATAFDHFHDPDQTASQRQFAKQHGVPRSTLGSWLRKGDPEGLDPDLVAFFRSSCGLALLRRVVLALFLVFVFRGACGVRLLGLFLGLTHLDRFVASSHGALHDYGCVMQADLGTFATEERLRLAVDMAPKAIALVADEHFHAASPCLVAIEPASNFLLVEQYADYRDAATWTTVITAALKDLPVEVLLLSSDQAKGLIACANSGLRAQHLPELFHGQRDLCLPFVGPLQRQKESAEKELRQAEELARYWRAQQAEALAGPPQPGRPKEYGWRIEVTTTWVGHREQEVRTCEARQEQAADAVSGLADDYHPFDGKTGTAVSAAQMLERLQKHLETLDQVAGQAELGSKATEALNKAKRWTQTLVAAVAWFWSVASVKVEQADLPEQAQQAVKEQLLAGLYWRQAARRARTADERRQKTELAERLLGHAWRADGVLGQLSEQERLVAERVGNEVVGLFARSSSCVEGRNGRLALFQHGQCRLSASRLQALTAVHNYVAQRPDGTTAAERFFGQKPRDVFAWLLQRLPDLPRPAAKRPNRGTQTGPPSG
jgi:hypothetical protein